MNGVRDLANELAHRQIRPGADQRLPLVEVRPERRPDRKNRVHNKQSFQPRPEAKIHGQGQPQRPAPVLDDEGDIAEGEAFHEAEQEISMEVKGVGGVPHRLVGTAEAEEVRRNHPCAALQHHRDHLAIKITPGRLTM
jgi:hypothetical protein